MSATTTRTAHAVLAMTLVLLSIGACAPRNAPTQIDSKTRQISATAKGPAATSETIRYGDDASQTGELAVPAGAGPHPVIVLIHGGCWQSSFNASYLAPLASALNREGYATWTIEYRSLGNGGGWPQTFVDAGNALDQLRSLALEHRLDLSRVVTVGHSAGGQLALWLPENSELRGKNPLQVRAAIGLGAITDLQAYRIGPAGSCHSAVDALLGGSPQQKPQRYAQTSPAQLLPPSVPQWLIQGRDDDIVPADGVAKYVKSAGPKARLVAVAGGHFEPVKPEGSAWTALLKALREALSD